MAEHYEVGDIVKLKKPHPCGSSEWAQISVSNAPAAATRSW